MRLYFKLFYKFGFIVLFSMAFIQNVVLANEPVFTYENNFDSSLLEQLKNEESKVINSQRQYSYIINLNNSSPKQIKTIVSEIFPNACFSIDPRTRALTLKADPKTYQAVKRVVRKLDKTLKQLKIEVKILEVTYYNFEQYKNIFSALTSGFKINYDFDKKKIEPASNLELELMNLTLEGKAKVLAKPTISTLDNHKSTIKVGDRIPYLTHHLQYQSRVTEVQYLDAGIELNIMPKISSPTRVTVEVDAKISSVKLWKTFGDTQYPILSSRETKTIIDLENKKTLIIAGLFDSAERENKNEIPLIANIPFIGDLFKGSNQDKESSDIVFLITPEIL